MSPIFEYHTGYYGAEMIVWAVVGAVAMVFAAAGLALFLLRGWSLYGFARRRGLKKAWLSWIPVGQDWIRGSLSDQYKYLTAGRNQSRRTWLTVLSAASLLLKFLLVGSVIRHLSYALIGFGYPHMGYHMARLILTVGGMGFVSVFVWIAKVIFHHLCMYDLYSSAEPNNGLAMTVLGVVVPLLESFFLVYIREKDGGMPPRKDAPPRSDGPVDAEYASPDDGPEQL